MGRGRPAAVGETMLVETVLKYSDVLYANCCIVVKDSEVWKQISNDLDKLIQPRSLYSIVLLNRYNILDKIKEKNGIFGSVNVDDSVNSSNNSSFEQLNASEIAQIYDQNIVSIEHEFEKSKLEELTTIVEYTRSTREAKNRKRKYRRFVSGAYQPYLSKVIWENSHLICGWNFNSQSINLCGTSGKMEVYCRCGSKGNITFSRYDENEDIHVKIVIVPGDGKKCGPQYLRETERKAVLKDIEKHGSVDQYRAAVTKDIGLKLGMKKPKLIRNPNVLHVAKTTENKLSYLHDDPIEAINIMKYTTHVNEIHDIGKDPFSVDFYLNEQKTIAKMEKKKSGRLDVSMDATHLKMMSIERPYCTKTKKLFLYVISLNTAQGQTTLAQRLGERHTAKDLKAFLYAYHGFGVPHPDEFCCDESRAILNAATQVYSIHETIDDYADSMKNLLKTSTRIRIDNAHFSGTYRKLLKGINARGVYTFYMAAIGKLILAFSKEQAEEIIRAIFIVANCPKTGNLPNGEPTECSKKISFLRNLITGEEEEDRSESYDEDENSDENFNFFGPATEIDEETSIIKENSWGEWGKTIFNESKNFFSQKGKEHNLYCIPKIDINKKLQNDIRLLPIWGNIFSLQFEGCRIPASSSSSESEFNRIKTYWLAKHLHSIRADYFVDKMLNYLKGKLPILASNLEEAHRTETDLPESGSTCKICNKVNESKSVFACYNCNELVHKKECTVLIEGKLICLECSKTNLAKRNAAHDSLENWGGIGEPRKKRRKITVCIACEQGHIPDGAHTCLICNVPVHIFYGCSFAVAGEEEGYGQKRICRKCNQMNGINSKEQANDTECSIGESTAGGDTGNSIAEGEKSCTECKNGDLPEEGYTCNLCNMALHIYEDCSFAIHGEDEGNVEKRICIACRENSCRSIVTDLNSSQIITRKGPKIKSIEYLSKENNKYRKQSKYHGKRADDVRDSIDWNKSKTIPVIRNGNDLVLEKQIINGKAIVLQKTCAIDSITYITVFAAHDFPHLKKTFETVNTQFMKLVLDIEDHNVRAYTYTLRAKVLSAILPMKPSNLGNNLFVLNSECEVGWMARQLFKPLTSVEEEKKCKRCGYQKINRLTTLQVADEYIKKVEKETFIEEAWRPTASACPECQSQTETTLLRLGNLIIFSVYNEEELNQKIKLENIPKELGNPLNKSEKIYLAGAVGYVGPEGIPEPKLRSSGEGTQKDEDSVGHYIAYSYRRGNTCWMEANDTVGHTVNKASSYKIVPRLLVYVK